MGDSLVDRLRDGEWWQTVVRGPNPTGFSTDQTPTVHEAADVITALEGALVRLLTNIDTSISSGAVVDSCHQARAALSLLRGGK